ncbi:ABC transporter substrate-binding protein [Clostridium tertium]|uniref:ABC transporter substrate-binding protein n=1 Tax=Clostridium tertium TaxID=1559 RepID=UPI001AE22421|nr:MqnA/MqnD/SBP family protein [Clostridium tertium]MBP1868538.1 NitT/TauT family transport system substrate-binding protein [Clostridium tertium]
MRRSNKIKLSIFFIATIFFIFTGCKAKVEEDVIQDTERKEISIVVPNGVPSTAISKLIKENIQVNDNYAISYSIENTSDTLATSVMKGEPDIAIVPSNLAAQAYNKGLGYKLVGTTGYGALYLVSTEGKIEFNDIKGKEVYNIGSGLTPDIVFKALLKESGILNDVTLSYVGGATELAPAILSGKAKYAVVPEPALTTILSKNPNIKIIASLNDLWKEKFNSKNGFPQASIIVKEEIINNDKDFLNELIDKVNNSIQWVNENNKEAADYSVENGSQVEAPIIEKSIKNSNINFSNAADSKQDYLEYFKVLENENAKSIGEKIPNEDFFYEG